MLDIPNDFAQRMGAETTWLAFCWRITRADGVALGFTSHDRDLELDGLVYRSAPGIAPSAIHLTGGFEADSMDIAGALSVDAITESDLASGRYDGARVSLFLVDWSAPKVGHVPMMRGYLGAITHGDGGFTAELRSAAYALDQPATELLSPECRAQLGDRRCRVDLSGRTRMAVVVAVPTAQELRIDHVETFANGYGYGRLRFLSGRNCGLDIALSGSAADRVFLAEPPAHEVVAGVKVELREGCDRRFTTCRKRFNNAVNFQGEPHVPGNDLLTRYPGI